MAQRFPYTYISCPCSEEARRVFVPNRASRDLELENDAQIEEKTFDPKHPRSNFSLFPPEHLLYCEECLDIKCPRCVTEEIICWYCPGCLFEVPSSSVKYDDNRCSRNCFSCPICMSQLITASLGETNAGPYVLSCNYCMWSSLDIGLQFESANQLRTTIDKLGIGGVIKKANRIASSEANIRMNRANLARMQAYTGREITSHEEEPENKSKPDLKNRLEPNTQFHALKAFYKDQLITTNSGSGTSALDNFASPSSLSRIMNLYNNAGNKSSRTSKPQNTSMREANSVNEGFILQSELDGLPNPTPDFIDAVTPQQSAFQHPQSVGTPTAQHQSQLRPMATKLRTKRSKRCAECKHILVKPEFKVTSTRYRIKLIALNYIPTISLRPVPVSGGLKAPRPDGMDVVLEPGKPSQWIMRVVNPLFENVNVSLGSPSVVPGRYGHRVTILCPQFSVGKNGDVWDDALNSGTGTGTGTAGTAGVSGSGSAGLTRTTTNEAAGEQIAGRVYESGRNWASVVVEVIPVPILRDQGVEMDEDEDEDVVEIPIRVRLEWTITDDDPERGSRRKSVKGVEEDEGEIDDGKRELAYWMVVGIGRVGR